MKFEYQAIDIDGIVVRGIIEASSAQKVLQILLHKQLHPLDIKHLTESTVELSRLNSLKRKLEGKELEQEPIREVELPKMPEHFLEKSKPSIDWTYVFFILVIIVIISTSLLELGI